MRVAVFRASGQNWNPEIFFREYKIAATTVWLAGERYVGRLRADSGFNVAIADAASCTDLVAQIHPLGSGESNCVDRARK